MGRYIAANLIDNPRITQGLIDADQDLNSSRLLLRKNGSQGVAYGRPQHGWDDHGKIEWALRCTSRFSLKHLEKRLWRRFVHSVHRLRLVAVLPGAPIIVGDYLNVI